MEQVAQEENGTPRGAAAAALRQSLSYDTVFRMALLSPEGEQWNCVAVNSTDGWTEITAPALDDEDEADYIPRHTEGRELKSTCNLL